jgi:hypothetical protein
VGGASRFSLKAAPVMTYPHGVYRGPDHETKISWSPWSATMGTDARAPAAAAKPLWAAGYHLVGVTLAAGAQAPIGFAISTPVGASPMSSTAGVAVPTARRV